MKKGAKFGVRDLGLVPESFTPCVILGKLLELSEPPFPTVYDIK